MYPIRSPRMVELWVRSLNQGQFITREHQIQSSSISICLGGFFSANFLSIWSLFALSSIAWGVSRVRSSRASGFTSYCWAKYIAVSHRAILSNVAVAIGACFSRRKYQPVPTTPTRIRRRKPIAIMADSNAVSSRSLVSMELVTPQAMIEVDPKIRTGG